jgi:hypothetical protein
MKVGGRGEGRRRDKKRKERREERWSGGEGKGRRRGEGEEREEEGGVGKQRRERGEFLPPWHRVDKTTLQQVRSELYSTTDSLHKNLEGMQLTRDQPHLSPVLPHLFLLMTTLQP